MHEKSSKNHNNHINNNGSHKNIYTSQYIKLYRQQNYNNNNQN